MLLDTFTRFDRLGRDLFSVLGEAQVDVRREKDRYVIDADLPGIDPASVDVTVDGGSLTIRAERSTDHTDENAQWLVRERSSAQFVRRFTLGSDADLDGIQATYNDGVLSVVIPVAEGSRRHKIPLAIGSGQDEALQAPTTKQADGTDQGKAQAAHSQES